jgi:diguanylate cyclase (GGDEF)-like protein/PAS domain S-box-containing protein
MNWQLLSENNFPVGAAMIEYGSKWIVKDVSEPFCMLCGCKKNDLLALMGQDSAWFLEPDDRERFELALKQTADGGRADAFLMRVVTLDKKVIWVRAAMSLYGIQEDVPYVLVIFTDAQEQKRMEQQLLLMNEQEKILQEKARRDPLTRLLDKEETHNMVNHLLDNHPESSYVMLLIDVDNFKQINDTFGHTFGDTVILDVASMIRDNFREEDVVGRIGGDEFLVFMNDAGMDEAVNRAARLCAVLEKEYSGGDVSRRISVSIGLSEYGVDGSDYRTLMEKADHAMYRVKMNGKNSYAVALADDVGPVRSDTKTVENRGQINQSDSEFLSFAVNLMTHARNIDGSLNLLVKNISDRFHLDFIGVFEHSAHVQEMVLTNYYSRTFSFYDRTTFPRGSLAQELAASELKLMRGIGAEDSAVLAQIISGSSTDYSGAKFAAAVTKFEYVGGRTGEIACLTLDNERDMDESTKLLLQELTRTIGVFVSLRYRMGESREEIRNIQRRDQLTGMYTLEAFKENVRELLREPEQGQQYFLEYVDINNFGYVNDNYGYQVGDNALKTFAEDCALQEYFVAGCRLYSDFFVMLLKAKDAESFKHQTMAQHQRFANIQNHQYPSSSMTIASGAYLIEGDHVDVDTAIENAILAWKVAKGRRSKEPVFFEKGFREARSREQQVIGEFYEALYRDDFRMYLQPKFRLGDHEVYGAEALARWQKPDGTILPPGAFLEPLEQIGYVMELDFYIFEELLKTMTRWQTQNRRQLVVSTNFSGTHFESDVEHFLKRIDHLISKYSISPQFIEIEVTESVMVHNQQNLRNCMERLHEMGFRIAIDDFGTGYSSLSVLMDIPADVVKMDKSFIDNGIDEKRRNMIVEIGELVRIAGKEIIFEGIETEEQEKLLLECGFKNGQGYLCNRPIRVSEFEKLYF